MTPHTLPTTVLAAVVGGADLKTIGGLTRRLRYAAPNIKAPKDPRRTTTGYYQWCGTKTFPVVEGLRNSAAHEDS
ncbi:MAG TPA: hypothetical protein VF089_17245 [Candidatus Binatia bacterium]